MEADTVRGLRLDQRAARVPLAVYADGWLRGRTNIASRTLEIYEQQLRLYILPLISPEIPALGRVPLAQITPELVRARYAALRRQKGPSIAAKSYVRLRQILTAAVDDERILRNPCRIPGGGAERRPEQQFVTMEKLYELAEVVPDRYRAPRSPGRDRRPAPG